MLSCIFMTNPNQIALPVPPQQSKDRESGAGEDLIKSGYLRVIPSYRTGLTRGTSVKLYIENTTTTMEVINLVVKQVAKATGGAEVNSSDFYLVAVSGKREWTLNPDYHPLQLQANPDMKKIYLHVKRKSDETNQLVTSV